MVLDTSIYAYSTGMRRIILIAHDIRSTHNVGSLLRTADGLGIEKVYFTGYTPYPSSNSDRRLPHIAQKLHKQIAKTALGAEQSVTWEHRQDIGALLEELKAQHYTLLALEQAPAAVTLPAYEPTEKIAIVLGREVEGVDKAILELVDTIVEIPMFGSKESFNVVQAAAMVMYHCRFA